MTAYAEGSDLLIGDMGASTPELDKFAKSAGEEIDSHLGAVYVLPLTAIPPATSIPDHIKLMLKRINVLIATGRFILARASAAEDDGLHAYGVSQLQEGQMELAKIVNGQTALTGVLKVQLSANTDDSNAPTIIQGDAVSGVDAYYGWLNGDPYVPSTIGPGYPHWRPGT